MATKGLDQSTPPSSPHANWSMAPLLPRKSPERRRLALGHKSTQSLNIPRSTTFSKLEDILSSERKDESQGKVDQPLVAKPEIKSTELTIPQPTVNDPIIISPRPRRHTDVRALEAAQALVDKSSNTTDTRDSRLDMYQQMTATPPQVNRLADLQAGGLSPRKHVRGARSLSPTRHERSESMPFSSAYLEAHKITNRVLDGREPNTKLSLGSPLSTMTHELGNMRLTPSKVPAAHSHSVQSPVSIGESEPIDSQPNSDFARTTTCLTDEQIEADLSRQQGPALASVETEVDWAAAVLRLVLRQETRRRHISATNPREPSAEILRLQQCAVHSIASLCQSSSRAAYLQAVLFETGQAGTIVDRKQAFQLYKDASRAGYARADYRLGLQFERMGDIKTACETYERGAGADDSACLYRMGLIILKGQYGYEVDEQKGTNCIHLSALSADADAPQGAFAWALMLATETTLPVSEKACRPDVREAVRYFELAASLGMSAAAVRLAKAHEFNELDCPYSPLQSLHYYNVAAQADHPEGDMGLSKWYLAGSDDGLIQKDEAKSFRHAAWAASRGLGSAEFALGYFFEVGIACPVDVQKAQQYYARAREHGSQEATARLEGLSRSGTLSRQDHELNVQTQIHQRRATIKLNQKTPGRHLRTRSALVDAKRLSSQNITPMKPLPEGAQLHDQSVHTQPPVSTDTVVQRLDVAQSPNSRMPPSSHLPRLSMSHSRLNSEVSVPWQAHERHASSSTDQTPTPTHQRSPSRVPIALHDPQEAPSSEKNRWPELNPSYNVAEPNERQNNLVQSWTQQTGSRSVLGSPNLAPSEVASLQDNGGLDSPRPESSISNIPPYMRNHVRADSKNPSIHSQASMSGSMVSTNIGTASETSVSATSRKAGATTFEEMGIPMVNKKKEDCIVM